MKLLDVRTVTGHNNIPVLIADVRLDGAILPVSMPYAEYIALNPIAHTVYDFTSIQEIES